MDIYITPVSEDKVEIKSIGFFAKPKFQKYIATLHDIGQTHFNGETKVRTAALAAVPSLLQGLTRAGFVTTVDPQIATALQEKAAEAVELRDAGKARMAKVDEMLRASGRKLFPYQRTGISWLAPRTSGLLNDDMGLGKTIQAALAMPDKASAMVVCPGAVLSSWKKEILSWRPDLTPTVIKSGAAWRWPGESEVMLCTYGTMPGQKRKKKAAEGEEANEGDGDAVDPDDDFELPSPPPGVVLIADEAHLLKNAKAARTKAWRRLQRAVHGSAGRVWVLTGTPILNRPPELWNVLKACDAAEEAFGSWMKFLKLFGAKRGAFGIDWSETTVSPMVPEFLRRVALGRRRHEVLPDLPVKRREQRLIEQLPAEAIRACNAVLEAMKAHGVDLFALDADADLGKMIPGPVFELMSKARALLATAKVPAMLEAVEEYEEVGEPLVVGCAHVAPLKVLAERPGWKIITGEVDPDERGRIVEEFQAGRLKGVGLTYAAGGVGITLTKASNMLLVDWPWTPALILQLEDRICRIGQSRGCFYRSLVADHPLDSRVAQLLFEKMQLIDAAIYAAAVPGDREDNTEAVELAASAVSAAALAVAAPPPAPVRRGPFRPDEIVIEKAPSKEAKAADPKLKRGPCDERELHAARGMMQLAGMDADRARVVNGQGFGKFDTDYGCSLAKQIETYGRLSDKQWASAVMLAYKYRRQIGELPTVSTGGAQE